MVYSFCSECKNLNQFTNLNEIVLPALFRHLFTSCEKMRDIFVFCHFLFQQ